MRTEAEILRVERWLGKAWVCPDCGRVLRKPNRIEGGERFHSYGCRTPMVSVKIDWNFL